jgi:transcriptional regulator with XRE-family HTH domain
VAAPMRAVPTELAQRLRMIGMNQTQFAKRTGVSRQRTNRYCHGAPMPASVERALQLEELAFAVRALINTAHDRIPKSKLRVLVVAAEPRKLTPPPKPRKRSGKRSKVNWLSAKYLPVAPAKLEGDELERSETWTALASRVGVDAAAELHRKLAQRRPHRPRRQAEDGPPGGRTTEPI